MGLAPFARPTGLELFILKVHLIDGVCTLACLGEGLRQCSTVSLGSRAGIDHHHLHAITIQCSIAPCKTNLQRVFYKGKKRRCMI